ncbi:hypothetical protein Bca101_026811 [Brassica carinata]
MGRSPCCEKAHTNKGAWTKEEDQRLIDYIRSHGEGCWRSLPKSAAGRLPGRTDNEIKNYWNTHIKRKLLSHGIDPQTHRPVKDNVAVTDPKTAPYQLSAPVIVPPQNYAVEYAFTVKPKTENSSDNGASTSGTTTDEDLRQNGDCYYSDNSGDMEMNLDLTLGSGSGSESTSWVGSLADSKPWRDTAMAARLSL